MATAWPRTSPARASLAGTRTEEQALSFQSGSQNVHLWFGHTKVISLLSTSQPPGRSFDYFEGGWTTFEKFVSEFRNAQVHGAGARGSVQGAGRRGREGSPDGFARLNKESYDKVAEVSGKSAHRSLAVARGFHGRRAGSEEIHRKRRHRVLQDLYRKSFHAVVCDLTELNHHRR